MPSRVAKVDPTSAYVLKLLADTAGLAPSDTEALARWWKGGRQDEENVVAFLIRQGVFVGTAGKTAEMMRKGYVTLNDTGVLFTEPGRKRLREGLAAYLAPPPPPSPPPAPAPALTASTRAVMRTSVLTPAPAPVEIQERNQPTPTETLAAVAVEPEVGTTLGRCLLLERIGRGAAGVVFRAMHKSLNIPVAVKLLRPEVSKNDPNAAQLLREARLLAQLNHPNVIRVFDFDDDPRLPYLVVELVEGMSLAQLIESCGRLRTDRAVHLTMQVAQGLAAAWAVGVVHRDVKPANILVTRDGIAKLADMGLALRNTTYDAEGAAACQGDAVGTAAYVAPEQALGKGPLDHRTDQYSLGVTLYHTVTGHLPFNGRTPVEVVMQHVSEPPRSPQELVPELPDTLAAIILRMLAKDPGERYQSYDDLIADLGEVERAEGIPAVRAGETSIRRTSRTGEIPRRSLLQRLFGSRDRNEADKEERQ